MDAHLVDQIYECSFRARAVAPRSCQLANIASARTGWLFIAEDDGYRLSVSNEIVRPVNERLVRDGTVARSQRFAKLCAARHPGFLREVNIYTDDELRSDPLSRPSLRDSSHVAAQESRGASSV